MKRTVLTIILFCIALSIYGEYVVGDHELIFMPTAYTMPKGSKYFSDYELIFINFTFAPTDRTHIGLFTLFPITSDFLDYFALGVKQNYYKSLNVESAAWFSFLAEADGISFGNVLSMKNDKTSLHIAISQVKGFDASQWETIYMLGAKSKLGGTTSFIIEYGNTSSAIENDFDGLLTFGIRLHSSKLAWDLAGVRILGLDEDVTGLLLLPMIKVTAKF
jgi:hypothetical protein